MKAVYLRKTAIRGVLNFTTQHIARPTNDNDREIYRQAVLMWEVPMERIYTVVKFMNG